MGKRATHKRKGGWITDYFKSAYQGVKDRWTQRSVRPLHRLYTSTVHRFPQLTPPQFTQVQRRLTPTERMQLPRKLTMAERLEIIRAERMQRTQEERDTEKFVSLCKYRIMVDDLDSVKSKVWMQKDDCNIFIIGERHRPHDPTKHCKAISVMFHELIEENNEDESPVKIDILLEEFAQYCGMGSCSPRVESFQIDNVRHLLRRCMNERNCNVRIHWTDSTGYKGKIPEWLYELGICDILSDECMKNELVKQQLQEEKDLLKLVTENQPVMKEIVKASLINSDFNVQFALSMFESLNNDTLTRLKSPWHEVVPFINRNVIDIYTIARLIKLQMKRVIIYAGDLHARNCIKILTALGFVKKSEISGLERCTQEIQSEQPRESREDPIELNKKQFDGVLDDFKNKLKSGEVEEGRQLPFAYNDQMYLLNFGIRRITINDCITLRYSGNELTVTINAGCSAHAAMRYDIIKKDFIDKLAEKLNATVHMFHGGQRSRKNSRKRRSRRSNKK